MSPDRITFACKACGHAVSIDKGNPPNDDDILSCFGCGFKFGTYAQVREGMRALARTEVERLVKSKLGVKPTWTKR